MSIKHADHVYNSKLIRVEREDNINRTSPFNNNNNNNNFEYKGFFNNMEKEQQSMSQDLSSDIKLLNKKTPRKKDKPIHTDKKEKKNTNISINLNNFEQLPRPNAIIRIKKETKIKPKSSRKNLSKEETDFSIIVEKSQDESEENTKQKDSFSPNNPIQLNKEKNNVTHPIEDSEENKKEYESMTEDIQENEKMNNKILFEYDENTIDKMENYFYFIHELMEEGKLDQFKRERGFFHKILNFLFINEFESLENFLKRTTFVYPLIELKNLFYKNSEIEDYLMTEKVIQKFSNSLFSGSVSKH